MKDRKTTLKTRNQSAKPEIKSENITDDKMVHVYFKINGVTCPFVKGRISKLKAFNLRENIKRIFTQLEIQQDGKLIFTQ